MVTWGLVYHAVLAERRPLEATARPAREVHSWCGLFRKCLDAVALATGFISSMRRSPPPRCTSSTIRPMILAVMPMPVISPIRGCGVGGRGAT
jgi:hypothetical protein